jgi:hypothetical protein
LQVSEAQTFTLLKQCPTFVREVELQNAIFFVGILSIAKDEYITENIDCLLGCVILLLFGTEPLASPLYLRKQLKKIICM